MSFHTIKKCLIHVDGKKYTKNEIKIGDNLMFIYYSKPKVYSGKIMIELKKPPNKNKELEPAPALAKHVDIKESDGNNFILRFTWKGPWVNEDTGKESEKTLDFKIKFERSIDSERVYLALIGKPLDGKYKIKGSPRKTKRKKVKKTKKKSVKNEKSLKQIIKNISDKKILQLMNGRSFDSDKNVVLYQAKTFPEKYFKREELIKYSKNDKKSLRKGPSESATKFKVGTIKKGNDNNMWKIVLNKKGIQRWQKISEK